MQARRLRLSLSMHFDQNNDPRGLCKDVSNVGRWGNGDVKVGLDSEEELPLDFRFSTTKKCPDQKARANPYILKSTSVTLKHCS